jgi:homoprotocatechuate degradation regulator HpaR
MSTATFRNRNLALLLLQSREALMAHFRPLLNQHGVTEQQWRIIRALSEEQPLEPRQLCERCQISSPSIAGVLARMEELGWVQRERMDADQRRLLVSLTPQSRRIARSMAPLVEAKYQELETLLGTQTLEQVYAALDTLLQRLGPVRESEEAPEGARPAARKPRAARAAAR